MNMSNKKDQSRPQLNDDNLFVLYSPPDDANHYLIINDDTKSSNENKHAFIIHPFDHNDTDRTICIQSDTKLVNPNIDFRPNQEFERIITAKDDYLDLARYFKSQCEVGNFDKVVLSRIKKIYRDSANLMPLFLSLKQKYPYAFIYLLNIPGQSCWIGATPEKLLEKISNQYSTMALAGTAIANNKKIDSITWGQKEIHEQALVEDYFENIIKEIDSNFNKNEPYNKKAGMAIHLCTDFNFESDKDLTEILELFHPSPAVCGLPKQKSFNFIINSEQHPRSYYTGYLGPVTSSGDSHIFVNLRCMEVSGDAFYLYVGGGITKDSDPLSEWQETELKSTTLQSIIEKMYLYADVIR
jgi:isochorismate synthase